MDFTSHEMRRARRRASAANSHPRAALLFCLLPSLSSPAFPETQEAKATRQTEQTIAALTHMTDADSLAAAGLLSVDKHRDQALALIARATAAAPERADLTWLQVQLCNEVAPCDPKPAEQRLRELGPSNGAGWLRALTRAAVAKNDVARDAARAALSQSERVDFYFTTLVAGLSRAVVRTGKVSTEIAEVWVIGYLAREAIPAYQYVSSACKGERLQNFEVTETCRRVARSLQNGDTYLTEMIGAAIAKRVWPENSVEWNAAVEARRVYDYRSKLFPAQQRKKFAMEYLALCAENRREQDLFLALLINAAKNPNPPAE
jgi:hypothetical protein